MKYLKKYKIFESSEKLSIKRTSDDDKFYYDMKMGKDSIGNASLCKDLPDIFKKVRDGDIKLKKNEMYLELIQLNSEYVGKKLGTYLLKHIFNDLNLSAIYLFSTSHPRWSEIGTVVDIRTRKSHIYKDKMVDDILYKITKNKIDKL